MRRSPSNTHKSQRSPKQALHTRFSPKMEIIGTNFSKHNFDVKPEASSMLMLSPKQGIFGTLTKGISTLNKAIDKGQKYQQQATELYNKGQQLHQQSRQVYSQPPQQYPQQPQVYSQPPQQYPQQPQVYSQPPQQYPQQTPQVYSQPPQQYPQQIPQVYSQPPQQYPQQIPQPVQSITTHKKLHSSIVRKRCS